MFLGPCRSQKQIVEAQQPTCASHRLGMCIFTGWCPAGLFIQQKWHQYKLPSSEMPSLTLICGALLCEQGPAQKMQHKTKPHRTELEPQVRTTGKNITRRWEATEGITISQRNQQQWAEMVANWICLGDINTKIRMAIPSLASESTAFFGRAWKADYSANNPSFPPMDKSR